MSPFHEHGDDARSLDALILAALRQRQVSDDPLPDLAAPPPLPEEDQKALEALGPDFIAQILAGTWEPRYRRRRPTWQTEQELASAMQRGPGSGELSERAKEEMEQRIHDLDAADDLEEES